jgi:hypothetical protein
VAHGHDNAPGHCGDCGQSGRLRTARHGACIVFQSTNRFQPGKRRAGLVRCRPDAWATPFECGERSCVSPADARDTAPIRRLGQKGKNPPYCPRLNTPRPPQGGSGAGPCNITRHYAKWPHARPSPVNAATSHNAALCVNGPEGVPPTPAGGFAWCGCAALILIPRPPSAVSQRALQPAQTPARSSVRPLPACRPSAPKGAPPIKAGPCLRSCRGWLGEIAPGPVFGKGEMHGAKRRAALAKAVPGR